MIYIKTLLEMKGQGIISSEAVLKLIQPTGLNKLLSPNIADTEKQKAKKRGELIGIGKGSSPFSAVGKACFSNCVDSAAEEGSYILFKEALQPDDLDLIKNMQGVITSSGSSTSHPSVVLRQMGKALVCGMDGLSIGKESAVVADTEICKNDMITVDGTTGEIFKGSLPLSQDGSARSEVIEVLRFAQKHKAMKVLSNSEHIKQVALAANYGCDGIGLFRMEFMQTQECLKKLIRCYLVETNHDKRLQQLTNIYENIQSELIAVFNLMKDKEVTIRTIDYPMHELLESNREYNPMLGNRGVRLSILEPELFKVQIKAIHRAYISSGKNITLKILLPMVSSANEITILREHIYDVIGDDRETIAIGSMIETPRALFTIKAIAQVADFLSFGTNDLTQMIWGISRDDSYQFLPQYVNCGIVTADPFQHMDDEGVFEPIKIAVQRVRESHPFMEIGFCGEQLSHLDSLNMVLNLPINYVSVVPSVIPQTMIACAINNINTGRLAVK